MVFKGRKLKGFFFPVFGLVFLFITSLGNTPAYALSNNFQQYFDSWTGSTANTSQWSLTFDPSDGVNYSLNPVQFLASSGSPVADPYAPVTVVQPGPTTVVLPGAPVTAEYAAIEGDNTCNTCSAVTLTYSDPQSPVPPVSGAYIMIDVLNTGSAGKNYQLIVTDTKGNTISDSTDNVLVDCLNPPPNIQGTSSPQTWATVFIANTLTSFPVSTVSLVIQPGSTGDMDPIDADFVYVGAVRDAASLPCIVPPTHTYTPTITNTPTLTYTTTPTNTFTHTLSPTPTSTLTYTVSPTPTITLTNTLSPTPTSTNSLTPTITNTPTNTFTLTPTSTITNTVSPTPTFTSTPSPTPTYTGTATDSYTPTVIPTSTKTPTVTNSPTPSPTITLTLTLSPTITLTNTLTPTITNSPTTTPTPTPTVTSTNTLTLTNTLSPTNTLTPTNTMTLTVTLTITNTTTLTYTPTPSNTTTSTNTWTPTWTPTVTNTYTNTWTPTMTFTQTITNTPTVTNTPTITSTPPPPTDTPCPVNIYPNPMDFVNDANHHITFTCVPAGSTLNIYTISLSLVMSYGPNDEVFNANSLYKSDPSTQQKIVYWDGRNGDGNPVASGFYIYKLEGPNGRSFGKFAVSRSLNGP